MCSEMQVHVAICSSYVYILPHELYFSDDHSRVMLGTENADYANVSKASTSSKSDYINASYISVSLDYNILWQTSY